MAKQATQQVDALGFNRFQIANVKRAFMANKAIYTKMEKLEEKIKALGDEYEALEAQTAAWEAPAKEVSKQVLGIELSSKEILAFHASPEAFYQAYPQHELSVSAAQVAAAPVESEPVNEGTLPGTPTAPAEF